MRRAAQIVGMIALAITAPAFAKGSGGGHSGSHSSSHSAMRSGSGLHGHSTATGAPSTSGHHHRHNGFRHSAHARNEFMQSHPCPSTGKPTEPCPGYAIGGGSEGDPSPFEWQAVQVPM